MDSIVVSGAQGLLGRAILKSLQREFPESQIIALARTATDISGIKTVFWDLPEKIPSLHDLPVRFHYIHMANILKSEDSSQFYKVNCVGLQSFLDQFHERITSIIWSSSLSVLGQGPFLDARENESPAPKTALAQSRLSQEELIINFCKGNNIGCFGLRARLYVGPEEKEFNSYLRLILKKPFLAFNRGETKISVIGVHDYAEIVCELLKKMGQEREIFNVAYSTPLYIKDFLKSCDRFSRWTVSSKFLMAMLFFLLEQKRNSVQTKLELLGQDQVMNVLKLKSFLGTEVLTKKPIDIIHKYIK